MKLDAQAIAIIRVAVDMQFGPGAYDAMQDHRRGRVTHRELGERLGISGQAARKKILAAEKFVRELMHAARVDEQQRRELAEKRPPN